MKLSEDIQTLIYGIDNSINGSPYRQSFVWIKEKVLELEQRIDSGQVETHCYVQERFDAWKEGSVARLKGMKLPDCPYKSRSRKADAWENGWEVTDLNLDCT